MNEELPHVIPGLPGSGLARNDDSGEQPALDELSEQQLLIEIRETVAMVLSLYDDFDSLSQMTDENAARVYEKIERMSPEIKYSEDVEWKLKAVRKVLFARVTLG